MLQKPFEVTLGGVAYTIQPPTLGTMVLASECISRIPELVSDDKDMLDSVLFNARKCAPVAELFAIFIIGAKGMAGSGRTGLLRRLLPRSGRYDRLCASILRNATPREITLALVEVLRHLDVEDFFGITTFLQGINLTKPTKVGEQTAPGR